MLRYETGAPKRSAVAAMSALLATLAVGSAASADAVIVKPTEAQSKDTFVYSFLPTFNFNAPASGFHTILASGRSTSAHDLRTLIQFDLSGVNLAPGEIATLNLFISGGNIGFPVISPSPGFGVTTDVFANTSDWSADTVNWSNQPSFAPTALDTQVIDGIGRYVTFDVTAQVQAWLANPSSNFGFSIQQRDVVVNGGSVQAIYHSSSNENRPFLYAGPVPEPTVALAVAAGGFALLSRRRRA